MERMPGGPDTSYRPQPSGRHSHRQQGRSHKGLAVGAGVAVAVAGFGVAVAVGAVPSPLSSGSGKTLQAATLAAPSSSASEKLLQASASPLGSYALAKMPTPSHKPKPTPSKTTASPTPTHTTATPTATQSTTTASGGGLTPQPTAEYQTPRGENQKAWSEAILTALGAPLTSANIVSIGYWMQNEAGSPPYGIVGANNPINVSQPCCGGVPIQDDGDGVTFLQSYPTVADGVEAIAQYLNRGNYTQILADLKAGVGLNDPNLASEISLYSGGGYSTIPDSYGQSQGAPLS
jgi:hypothetical protein